MPKYKYLRDCITKERIKNRVKTIKVTIDLQNSTIFDKNGGAFMQWSGHSDENRVVILCNREKEEYL